MYRQSEKKFLSSKSPPHVSAIKVNFGPLAAEIVSGVWGAPATFNGFRALAACARHVHVVVGVSQTLRR